MSVDAITDGSQHAAYTAPNGFHTEPLPSAQTRRFKPKLIILSPRQSLYSVFPAPRHMNSASFDVQGQILPAMVGNMLGIIDSDGSVHDINTVNGGPSAQQFVHESDGSSTLFHSVSNNGETRTQRVETSRLIGTDGIIVPVAPWGDNAIMVMHMNPSHPTLPSIPGRQLKPHMRVQSAVMRSFQNGERPVYWGNNVSPGNNLSSTFRGVGLQTINLEHDIAFSLPDTLDGLTPDDIVNTRSGQPWDDGISEYLGGRVAHDLNNDILPSFGKKGSANADRMGVHAMVDMSIDDFGTPDFATIFWGGLIQSMHRQLRDVHRTVFTSELADVHGFTQARLEAQRPMSVVEQEIYDGYFERRRPETSPETSLNGHIASQLNELYDAGDGRYAPALTGTVRFNPDGHGAFVLATFGIVNGGIPGLGPVESLGIGLKRPADPLPTEVMETKREQIYKPAMEHVLLKTQ